MPRPRIKNRQEWRQNERFSDEHDDRDRKPTQRRVSFKPSTGGFSRNSAPMIKNRTAEMAIKSLEDDDVMYDGHGGSGGSGGGGYNNKFIHKRRKGSPIPRGKLMPAKRLQPSTSGWYQVTIPFGQKFQKDEVIRLILNGISPDIFIPHYWKQEKTCINFYVDEFKIAERLQQADRTIQFPDGFRMVIKVRRSEPVVQVDEEFKEKMKLVMAKRYNAVTKALDLSRFHADPDFKGMFCALFRPEVMSAAIDIITAHIPDLEALNLSNNQIQHSTLERFTNVAQKIPNLKILHLSDNRVHSAASLSVFRGTPIVELILTNNPIHRTYKDNAQYVSEVRRKFPKLLKLDGQDLEPELSFDVAENTSLPNPEASFFCNPEGVDIIREFLKQYFQIYDSDNRQPLLDAYHEQAMISLACPSTSQGKRLSNYWPYNRNLLRTHDHEAKFRSLKYGRLPVVSFLSELPKTQHDLMSFSVDLTLFTPQLISFTVAGLYKEPSTSSNYQPDILSFQRHFVIVPGVSGGFCIRNEMISISIPTPIQVREAFKVPSTVASAAGPSSQQQRIQIQQQPIPSTSQLPPAMQPQQQLQPQQQNNDSRKLEMIMRMSAHSNMNLDWSKKCLEETNWDFDHATFVFNQLHRDNKIPPEAFVK